jgi:hypothetical protein
MTSLLRTTTRAGVVTVLSVVGLVSLGACSAVLGIGDWVDLTDGGSGVGDAGSDARNADDGQTGDATIADGSSKDARVDAALDHAAPSIPGRTAMAASGSRVAKPGRRSNFS